MWRITLASATRVMPFLIAVCSHSSLISLIPLIPLSFPLIPLSHSLFPPSLAPPSCGFLLSFIFHFIGRISCFSFILIKSSGNQGLETDEIGDRNTKSGNSISTGAIIGISVGAVALVVAIAVGVTMNQTRRRREQRKRVNTIVGENQRP